MRLIKQHFLVITTSFLMTMTYGQPAEERMQAADRLGSAIAQIDHYYIKPMPLDRLMGFAISGMLTQLDPHSSYLNEEDLQALIEQTEGDFAGIGVEMIPEDSLLRVISPIEGSVADRSGIKPDDIIVAIDGTLVDSLTADEAQRMVRGEVGTTVDLVVFRQGVDEPLTFHLTREQVVMQEVRHRSYGDIGLIRIAWFTEGTADEVRQHITTLRQENPRLKGLILDLRNNPGGVLDAAAGTADLFLDQGALPQDVIVSTKGRHSEHDQVYRATAGDMLQGLPIVVLVNSGSASASEVVAAALRDHHRGILVGTKTFGKGSVQAVIPLDEKTAIKMTVALYYGPDGETIQAKGITPAVFVPFTEMPRAEQPQKISDFIDEAKLSDYLTPPTPEEKKQTHFNDVAHEDFQLYQALNILSGLS